MALNPSFLKLKKIEKQMSGIKERWIKGISNGRRFFVALCRCLKYHNWPKGKRRKYVAYVIPVGYPNTSSICGLCDNPGVIWLESSEVTAYQNGQRIFKGPSAFTKIKADNSGIYK